MTGEPTTLQEYKDSYYKASKTLGCVIDSIETYYIWCKDSSGVYQIANKAFAKVLGTTWCKIVGKTDYDLFPKEQADKFTRDDKDVLVSCGTIEYEEIVHDVRYGDRIWKTSKNAICKPDGDGLLVVGIAIDITEHVKMRASAEKAIEELEAFVKRNSCGV